MTGCDRAWALTAMLLGIHQSEEVLLSIQRWVDEVGTTGVPLLDAHLRDNPLAGLDWRKRVGVVASQGVCLWVLYRVTKHSRHLTRVVTSSLVLMWASAFCMHIGVSLRTHSFMPGTATSVFPGLPGAVFVWRRIRALTR